MAEDRRNPYLILGLEYGASKDKARRAAARVLRKVREASDSLYSPEDVTWALHEVEHLNDEPEAGFTIFRVPASGRGLGTNVTEGIFAPTPRSQARSSPPSTDEDLSRIAGAALVELASDLLMGRGDIVDVRPSYDIEGEP